jgi:alpha-ketoglutarate-dependent taurine dioxygenase
MPAPHQALLALASAAIASARLAIEPIRPPDKRLSFGAVVRGLSLRAPLSEAELAELDAALSEHGLLLLESAAPPDLEPRAFSDLVRRLNPGAETV